MYKNIKRKGFSILELALAITVASSLMTIFLYIQTNNNRFLNDKNIALQMQYLGEASKKYIITNSVEIRNMLDGGAGPITVSMGRTSKYNDHAISGSMPSLQDAGLLSSTYIDTNRYLQNTVLLINYDEKKSLTGLLFTVGGNSISDSDLGYIMSFLGMNGGYIPTVSIGGESGGSIYGYNGSWSEYISSWMGTYSPSQGHIIYRMQPFNEIASSDYLSRYDTGLNDDTSMHTGLEMSNNNVNVQNLDINYLRSSNGIASGNRNVNPYDNNITINSNVQMTYNLGVGMDENTGSYYRSNSGYVETNPGDSGSTIVGGVHTRDIYAYNTVVNNYLNNISGYMSQWKGAIVARSMAIGNIIRSGQNVVAGSSCSGSINPISLDGRSPNLNAQALELGDMGYEASTGILMTCQKYDDGSLKWTVAMSPFSHTTCSSGSSYTNKDGVNEVVTFQTERTRSKSTDSFQIYLDGNLVWYNQHSDASIIGFLGISTKSGHYYSGMTLVPPGSTVQATGIPVTSMCITR